MKKGFIFYEDFGAAIKELDYVELKWFMEALIDYAFNDEEPEFNNRTLQALFELIKPRIKIVKEENER